MANIEIGEIFSAPARTKSYEVERDSVILFDGKTSAAIGRRHDVVVVGIGNLHIYPGEAAGMVIEGTAGVYFQAFGNLEAAAAAEKRAYDALTAAGLNAL
jgi:hypothetical protein